MVRFNGEILEFFSPPTRDKLVLILPLSIRPGTHRVEVGFGQHRGRRDNDDYSEDKKKKVQFLSLVDVTIGLQGEQGSAGEQINKGDKGDPGETGALVINR